MLRFALTLTLLAAVTLSSAQSLEDYKLMVDVELVSLPVSVIDKKGLPMRGLQQEHFTVYEDKVQQDITLFKQEDVPLSIVLLIDASGSMEAKLDKLHAAAMVFLRESNPADETAIVSFGDVAVLDQDFTTDPQTLSLALSRIPSRGSTALYDAIHFAAKHLDENGVHEKKVMLLISDGEDNMSQLKQKRVLEDLRESDTMVYSVGLLSSAIYSSYGWYDETGKKALKQLAEITGGVSYFPKSIKDIDKICAGIARDLRSQYTLGYRPSNEKQDGSWRKVAVRVNPPKNTPKLKVRTRPGYYAPESREARAHRSPLTRK